jgi:hypothetical protein
LLRAGFEGIDPVTDPGHTVGVHRAGGDLGHAAVRRPPARSRCSPRAQPGNSVEIGALTVSSPISVHGHCGVAEAIFTLPVVADVLHDKTMFVLVVGPATISANAQPVQVA